MMMNRSTVCIYFVLALLLCLSFGFTFTDRLQTLRALPTRSFTGLCAKPKPPVSKEAPVKKEHKKTITASAAPVVPEFSRRIAAAKVPSRYEEQPIKTRVINNEIKLVPIQTTSFVQITCEGIRENCFSEKTRYTRNCVSIGEHYSDKKRSDNDLSRGKAGSSNQIW